jgi:hypothetical protein
MASQRYTFVASQTFLLLFPLAISWDALFLVFCFLLSCSDSFFLFFVGAYHQSMVNVGAAKIELQSQSARDKYKQLATAIVFSLLNAII